MKTQIAALFSGPRDDGMFYVHAWPVDIGPPPVSEPPNGGPFTTEDDAKRWLTEYSERYWAQRYIVEPCVCDAGEAGDCWTVQDTNFTDAEWANGTAYWLRYDDDKAGAMKCAAVLNATDADSLQDYSTLEAS